MQAVEGLKQENRMLTEERACLKQELDEVKGQFEASKQQVSTGTEEIEQLKIVVGLW